MADSSNSTKVPGPTVHSRRGARRLLALILAGVGLFPLIQWAQTDRQVGMEVIVVPSLEEARSLHAKLEAGADFAALASQHSTDPTAGQGGYLGSVDPETMRPEVREALRGLRPDLRLDPPQPERSLGAIACCAHWAVVA